MNLTADLVAEALFNLELTKKKICRIYGYKYQDIFNVKVSLTPEWSIIYKMLFDSDAINKYTHTHTSFDQTVIEELDIEVVEEAAMFQIEYYFNQRNYLKDDHLRGLEDDAGWIDLCLVYKFNKLKKFQKRLGIDQLYQALKLSTVVEVAREGEGSLKLLFIRKRKLYFKEEAKHFLGFNIEKISELEKEQLDIFIAHKETFE